MSTLINYNYRYPLIFKDLLWIAPLILIGAFRFIHNPILVGTAVLLALVPWLTKHFRRAGDYSELFGPLTLLFIAALIGLGV